MPSNWVPEVSIDQCTAAKQATHESHPIGVPVIPQVGCHISPSHPLGNHANLEQFRRNTLDVQNVVVPHSPADNNFLAVLLGVRL